VDVRPAVIVAHVRRALAPPASPAAQIVAAPELAVPQLGVHDRAAVRLPVRPVADLAHPGLEVDAVAGAAIVVADRAGVVVARPVPIETGAGLVPAMLNQAVVASEPGFAGCAIAIVAV